VDLGTLGLPHGTRVAGNLPYNISSPILFRLLEAQTRLGLFADATLMLQKEVADRLVASSGSKDYGPLTIFTALHARVSRLLTLPPGAFHPPPKVTSAVVRVQFLTASQRPDVPAAFESMLRALFSARRKTVANGLKTPAAAAGTTPAATLARAGIDPRLRPEQLSVEQLLALARSLTRTRRT
jgi:16S rRNA (adenine1518-N6/adenine1519-N6)-dimethyltransferase